MPARCEVRRGYFAPDELAQFLAAAKNPTEKLWWLLCCDCGLRLSEMMSLRWTDIREPSIKVLGKGSRYRAVPIPKRVVEQKALAWASGAFDQYSPIVGLTRRAVQWRFQETLKRSGVKKEKLCIHSLRHTAATRLLTAGVDIHRVGVVLGHRSILTTTGYLHTNPAALQEAADKLDKMIEAEEEG